MEIIYKEIMKRVYQIFLLKHFFAQKLSALSKLWAAFGGWKCRRNKHANDSLISINLLK